MRRIGFIQEWRGENHAQITLIITLALINFYHISFINSTNSVNSVWRIKMCRSDLWTLIVSNDFNDWKVWNEYTV